ncbi:MAG: thiamine pyrophosphate-dependent enzyme [Gemmatimonadota bacterium]|nr:thiamine pyrophosphate-dependent enzyme [Gemmatimonadota bacterium]
MPLNRRDVVRRMLADRGDALVVAGLGSPAWDVAAAGDDDCNFYLWGGMGGAAMMGLGLALAQPDRRVIVVTGDGEMLMGLGSLATIAVQRPPNLSIVVLDNGRFGETGMQESHTAGPTRLPAVAAACGFVHVLDVVSVEELDAAAATAIRGGHGPWFVRVAVAAEELPRVLPERDGAILKDRFRAAVGADHR